MSSLINQRLVVSLSLTINTFVDNSWSDFQSDHTLFLEARSRRCCTVLSSNLYTVASGYVTVLFNRLMLFWFGWNSDGGPSTGTFYDKKNAIFGQYRALFESEMSTNVVSLCSQLQSCVSSSSCWRTCLYSGIYNFSCYFRLRAVYKLQYALWSL